MLAAEQAKEYEIEPDMEALLLFTGGTSGMPKGVPLTHRNIISNANQIGQRWKSARDDVVLHIPPMFHSADLVKTIYMIKGATQVYLPRFEPEFLLQTIEKFRVTFILLVPTMLMMTLESGLLEKYDLSSLRRMIYGASPMSADWIRRARQAFPDVEIAQGYGLTETSPLLSMLAHDEHTHALEQDNFNRLSSCGRPLPGVEIRIIGDDGNKMPTGEAGEIIVKGDNVFKGYINQAELNTETLNNGWFHTGDIGYFDDEGFLYLLDRKKDMIVCGGENVYSGEVETILDKHPRVLESAVIGIPDEILVERVEAVVVLDPGQEIKETELIDFCRKYIAGYKLPKKIHTVDSMPKSALGKILKTELRKKYSVS